MFKLIRIALQHRLFDALISRKPAKTCEMAATFLDNFRSSSKCPYGLTLFSSPFHSATQSSMILGLVLWEKMPPRSLIMKIQILCQVFQVVCRNIYTFSLDCPLFFRISNTLAVSFVVSHFWHQNFLWNCNFKSLQARTFKIHISLNFNNNLQFWRLGVGSPHQRVVTHVVGVELQYFNETNFIY